MAGFTSESVAAFRRNTWPTCVGINGWLGSEYAIGLNDLEALMNVAFEAKEWIATHALKR